MLTNKTILLVSPQSWGKMFVSKHHYAVELTRHGNKVYFLNPPEQGKSTHEHNIVIEPSGEFQNLFIIHHHVWFPYRIKFHFLGLFHLLMQPHVKNILKAIGKPVDIVWSFDIGNLYPFSFFPRNSYKIFHPVDQPSSKAAINSARNADIIFSVTQEILEKYSDFNVRRYFVNHGVAEYFYDKSKEQPLKTDSKLHVGISGNLLREDIDRSILLKIITAHPEIVFECWGSYQLRQSNIGGKDDQAVRTFIGNLQQLPNVIMHGVVDQLTLAKELGRMDAFLICYQIDLDQSRGTNYHKVMEYISTGKVIISNNISTYYGKDFLVQMIEERQDNLKLPDLFSKVMANLAFYNSEELMKRRKAYAVENLYAAQVKRIDELIEYNIAEKANN